LNIEVFINKENIMSRIIRLTERDLTRLVKKTIMELDRSTYDRAADVAGEKGYNKLSDRFREHGKEFGLNQGKTEILMVADMGGGNTGTYRIRITNIKDVSHYDIDSDDVEITLKTEDMVVGEEKTIMINKRSDKLKIYMPGIQSMALPKTRKDANKLLNYLGDNDIDVSNIDPRAISYEDSNF